MTCERAAGKHYISCSYRMSIVTIHAITANQRTMFGQGVDNALADTISFATVIVFNSRTKGTYVPALVLTVQGYLPDRHQLHNISLGHHSICYSIHPSLAHPLLGAHAWPCTHNAAPGCAARNHKVLANCVSHVPHRQQGRSILVILSNLCDIIMK
jgi:hypothetical protein